MKLNNSNIALCDITIQNYISFFWKSFNEVDEKIKYIFENLDSKIDCIENLYKNPYKQQTIKLQIINALRIIHWETKINTLIYK